MDVDLNEIDANLQHVKREGSIDNSQPDLTSAEGKLHRTTRLCLFDFGEWN